MALKPSDILGFFREIELPLVIMVAVILALILFLPDYAASSLSIAAFRDTYRTYLGPAFLVAVGLLLTKLVMAFWGWWRECKRLKAMHKLLHNLTPEEKGYLKPFIVDRANSIYVGLDDGVAGGLTAKKILYQSCTIGSDSEGFAHNLQTWAFEYLSKHPELLKGYVGTPKPRVKSMFWSAG